MTRKLLILHDSADFGGHERMLLALLPGVIEREQFTEIVFCFPESNQRLHDVLQAFEPHIRIITWPFVKRRGEPYLGWLRWRYRRAVRDILAAERPDTVLLVQGRIENLVVPMLADFGGARLVSYLPMAHRQREMDRNGLIGDRIRQWLYRRPDHYIVPSEAVAQQVEAAGGTAPITVAHNFVGPPPKRSKAVARLALGLPVQRRTALFLGRLDPAQKGLDRLVGAIERAGRERLAGWTFLFVGDGPGRPLLERTARRSGVDLRLVPWTDQPDMYLSAADVLLLPSRFEGLPLVLLEAMHCGLPVLASSIDVMRDYLPADALVDFDTVDLAAALASMTRPEAAAGFAAAASATLGTHTLEAAQSSFAAALAA
ncbi:glycosyltransferase [Sphingosinicellaceae bacterium]|nr:glycosyltransferase [Sphingosinicellaceae bacterium]